LLDKAVNIKVFHSGADIEPLTVVNNDSADFATLPNPFSDDRNKRQALTSRNPPKNFPAPN
jgi:hypothetical protein